MLRKEAGGFFFLLKKTQRWKEKEKKKKKKGARLFVRARVIGSSRFAEMAAAWRCIVGTNSSARLCRGNKPAVSIVPSQPIERKRTQQQLIQGSKHVVCSIEKKKRRIYRIPLVAAVIVDLKHVACSVDKINR